METERKETQFILVNPVSTAANVNSGIYSHQGCTTVIPKNSVSLSPVTSNQRNTAQPLMAAMPVGVVLSPNSYKKQMEPNISLNKTFEVNKQEPKQYYQVAPNVSAISFPKHMIGTKNGEIDTSHLHPQKSIDKVKSVGYISDLNTTNALLKVNGDNNHFRKEAIDGKMDLNKLDDTINSVLVLARSDEPCEGLFVLPNRRDATTSQNSQPVTPTPQNSPIPIVTSPNMHNHSTSSVSSTNLTANKNFVTSSRNVPRYIVDQMPGNLQFVSGVPQQSYQYAASPNVPTVLQVYPESSSSSSSHMQVNQHAILSQINQTVRPPVVTSASPTSMIIRPGVLHNVQQRQIIGVPHSLATLAALHRTTQASIISSVKINTSALNNGLVTNHQVAFPMSIVSHSGSTQTNFVSSRINNNTVATSSTAGVCTTASTAANICIIRKPVNQNVPTGNIVCRQPSQLTAAGVTHIQLSKEVSAPPISTHQNATISSSGIISTAACMKNNVLPLNSAVTETLNSSGSTISGPISVTSLNCKPIVAAKPLDNGSIKSPQISKKRTANHNSNCNAKKRKLAINARDIKVSDPSNYSTNQPITSSGAKLNEAAEHPNAATANAPMDVPVSIESSPSNASALLTELKSSDPKTFISNPPVQSFDIILPPLGSNNGTTCLPSFAKEMKSLRNRGLKYRRELFSIPIPKPIENKEKEYCPADMQDEYLCQHLSHDPPVNLLDIRSRKLSQTNVAASPSSEEVDRSCLPSLIDPSTECDKRDSITPPLIPIHDVEYSSNSLSSMGSVNSTTNSATVHRECLRISFSPHSLFARVLADTVSGIASFLSLPVECVNVDLSKSDIVIRLKEDCGTQLHFSDSLLKQLGLFLKQKFQFLSVHFSMDTIQIKKDSSNDEDKAAVGREEPMSFVSLSAYNKTKRNESVCVCCSSKIKESPVIIALQDLIKSEFLSTLCLKPEEESMNLNFCSSACLNNCSQCLLNVYNKLVSKNVENNLPNNSNNENKPKTLDNGSHNVPNNDALHGNTMHNSSVKYHITYDKISRRLPVILQPMTSKISRQLQKPLVSFEDCFNSKAQSSILKKWQGNRWLRFSPNVFAHNTRHYHSKAELNAKDLSVLLKTESLRLSLPPEADCRKCLLCKKRGDFSPNGPGRLLIYDIDVWIHLNCVLWCYEVYESISGSLHNVDGCVKKALKTKCSHCGDFGAGLPCYNPRCTSIYHVPCALEIKCMFFTDRGMYCPLHQPKDHPMQLKSLEVSRKVYITREENAQVANAVNNDEKEFSIRIGSSILKSLGQLLPHQIESGNFHTKRHIYPVGFVSTRTYWSMRNVKSRSLYVNCITESNNKPMFYVKEILQDYDDEEVISDTCDGAWKQILERIASLRIKNGLVKTFPQHIRGEVMYGLTEGHIVRAIESLPGLETLSDYCFNFGRMELISGMPLAINPSGSARSEPRMKTSGKHKRRSLTNNEISCNAKLTPMKSSVTTGRGRRASSVLSLESKSSLASKSQQYRRLRNDVNSNVILGRSRIQGFGLFASRDMEANTMVIEYIGEMIRLELANKREKEYEAQSRGIYMFRLDENTVIDATMTGGLARYVNHSCAPNCFTEYVNFGEGGHIVIITNQKIAKGEELSYDYKFDLEDETAKIPCLCGAANCRKWMN